MAGLAVNEVNCFVSTHFGSVPNDNIQTTITNFYVDDDLLKARLLLNDICVLKQSTDEIPRLIAHKGEKDKKKKTLSEDILTR